MGASSGVWVEACLERARASNIHQLGPDSRFPHLLQSTTNLLNTGSTSHRSAVHHTNMTKFCQHCYELPGELQGETTGSVKDVGGVQSYVTGSGKATIVYATDIFGLGIKNPKIIADALAKESGFRVVVPDVFEGEPMKPEEFVLPKHTSEGAPADDQMQQNMSNMTAWVQKGHSPNESFPLTKKVIDAVKSEGPVGIGKFERQSLMC